ncbi:MAG: NADH-quinone oxidoreductase subunit N [Gemmatimonadota bacterium]|jgi:NADH-quinone oxidoreductase subunit N
MELDFSSQSHFLFALLPEIILCVWGMLVLVLGVWKKEGEGGPSPSDLGVLSLVGILLAAGANGWLYGVTQTGGDGMVLVDRLRLFANWIFLLAGALSILISLAYVTRQRIQAGETYSLMLFAMVGMMMMGGTQNLIVIFLGLEVMSIAIYALAAMNRRDRKSAEAGLKYFLLGAFSTGFFLYGIALFYGASGTTDISEMSRAVVEGAVGLPLLAFGVAFLAIGFGFKVAAVPFHMWTPDVYEGAPAPITAFMATGVKAAAFVAFLRVFLVAFDSIYQTWYPILWWLAAITMVVANLIALVQSNVKRMLAYSSIAHAGYLLVALVAANETASAALLFYLLVYTLMNVGAFGIVIAVAHQGEDRLQIEDYAGFGWQQPLLGVFLTVFLLSLAGFPGTGGFMGKIFLLQGAVASDLWTLAVILVLATVFSYWYYLRVVWFMWMREAPSPDAHTSVVASLPMRVALVSAVALILYLGVFPGALLGLVERSVDSVSILGGSLAALIP